VVGGLALGVLERAYSLGRARRARVRRLGTIPLLQHSEERKLVRSRVPDRRGLAHPRYPTREKPKRLTVLGDYGFLPRTTGRAVRTRGSNCRGGRSSSIKCSDLARGTAPMTRCSKTNGRRGSRAARILCRETVTPRHSAGSAAADGSLATGGRGACSTRQYVLSRSRHSA
jgi:hypothetical protein